MTGQEPRRRRWRCDVCDAYGEGTSMQVIDDAGLHHAQATRHDVAFWWSDQPTPPPREMDVDGYYYDLGREIAWEAGIGRLDDPYVMGLMARVRAGDGFTQNDEWPEMPR